LFVNRRYESSGGQALPAASVDFVGLARASGLQADSATTVREFREAFAGIRSRGPGVLVLDTAFDPDEPIPPYSQRPPEIRERFADWLRRHP
ncbi:MAG: hypothetical protein ACE5FK_01640, partial [Candidatus Methylomirabilia bacterium]